MSESETKESKIQTPEIQKQRKRRLTEEQEGSDRKRTLFCLSFTLERALRQNGLLSG